MKIVYCTNNIRFVGGMERVTIVKANALAEIDGNEVFVIVTDNKVGPQVLELSPKVKLIDLDINYYNHDWERPYFVDLLVSLSKRFPHYKKLKEVLEKIKPDVVISVGKSEKQLVPIMRNRTWKIVREFHSERGYRLRFAKNTFQRLIAKLLNFMEFTIMPKMWKWDKIVLLTHEDQERYWQGWNNVAVIPNPTFFISDKMSDLSAKVVISLGRISPEKNLTSMVNSFRLVVDRHPDWSLHIYGGGDVKDLENLIKQQGLENHVLLKGPTNEVQSVFLRSSVFVLSSLYEGLPLVLTEAMECGVPVVSYQCPCGPKDIVTDGIDGFLVPVNDEKGMAERICCLIEDDELRMKMGIAAKEKAKKYRVECIIEQWMDLFEEIVNE